MPVTTRIQAEAEGITDEDMVSLENPPQPETGAEDVQQTESHDVDETDSCHPVFYLSDDIPVEYFSQLRAHTIQSSPWLEIATSDPYSESILAASRAEPNVSVLTRGTHTPHSPFLDWSFSALYEFHKTHLRPILTMEGRSSQFAYFTFLAVDSACVQSQNKDEWEIIVCSDGADYGETPATGPRLKVFRMRISEAMESLAALEMLVSTPTEVGTRSETRMSVMPPPIFAGPPDVAREFKWRAIYGLPEPEGEGTVEIVGI